MVPVEPITVTVNAPAAETRTPGDANADGFGDIFDALAILQYDVGWDFELQ